jgi:hypothetical protein
MLVIVLSNVSVCFSEQVSEVSIVSLSTDKMIYDPGENVTINVLLNNSGEAKNIVASALIKSYSTNAAISGMPLKTLHDVVGEASFSMIWDSRGFPVGDYYVEVVLNNTYGNLLDRRTCRFRLGRPLLNVTSFSVEPQHFKIGDQVGITLEALNTGSTNLSGSCILLVRKGNGSIWYSYQNFSSLVPGASLRFTSTWDTSSAEKGALYYVIGYVLYEGKATLPLVVMVSTNYLPTARFSYTPTKVGLGEEASLLLPPATLMEAYLRINGILETAGKVQALTLSIPTMGLETTLLR